MWNAKQQKSKKFIIFLLLLFPYIYFQSCKINWFYWSLNEKKINLNYHKPGEKKIQILHIHYRTCNAVKWIVDLFKAQNRFLIIFQDHLKLTSSSVASCEPGEWKRNRKPPNAWTSWQVRRVTVTLEPVQSLQTVWRWRGNWATSTWNFSRASEIQGGGSEMEPLSSQQEIICLIKDFPPSYSLGQSEVFHQWETSMIKRAPWAFRAGQRWVPCLHSRAKEDLFNPIGKV